MLRKLLASSTLVRLSTLLLAGSASLAMAQSEPAPRITQPIDDAVRVTLKGGVAKLASAQNDRGAASTSETYGHVRLVLKQTAAQRAALQKLLVDQQTKGSPSYHKWITPEQFGQRFGASSQDIQKLTVWLQQHGFKVNAVPKAHNLIDFSGSVAQLQDAFGVQIHRFQTRDRQFLSNTANPHVPAAFANVVAGVANLNTLKPTSQRVVGPAAKFDPSTGKRVSLDTPLSKLARPRPGISVYGDSTFSYLYVVAADAATIYNTPNSKYNPNYSGTNYDGTGVKIGVGGDSTITPSYYAAYRKLFVDPNDNKQVNIVNVDNVDENADAGEAYLDVEFAGGLAPGADLYLYASTDLYGAIQQALDDNTVDIFNLSFGLCEPGYSTTDNQTVSNWWAQAASQGIAVTVSTGDNGSAACDNPNIDTTGKDPNQGVASEFGLFVNGLASTPYNIAVGGTDYYDLNGNGGANFGTYADQPTSGNQIIGDSTKFFRTAKSYIPEAIWNNSLNDITSTIAKNDAYIDSNNLTNIVAASGGQSNCVDNTQDAQGNVTCNGGWAKPSWQRGPGVPNDSVRDIPDVSLLAANGAWGALWTFCEPFTDQNGQPVQGCVPDNSGSFNFQGVGGTSAAAPAFAGMLAIVQQSTGGRLGQATPTLYNLFNGAHKSDIFHDVTVGNNSVPCVQGITDCVANDNGEDFLTGWDTATDYDLASGMGSVNVANLVTYWNTAIGSTASTVTVTPSVTSSPLDQTFDLSIAITGSGATPTGQFTLTTATLNFGVYNVDPTGTTVITIPANTFTAAGDQTFTATYNGDNTFAPATGTATVTITGAVGTKVTPTLTLTPSAASIAVGSTVDLTFQATGTAGVPTGSVTITNDQGYNSGAQGLDTTGAAPKLTVPAANLPAGTVTFTATYSGDTNYNTGTQTATVTVAPPSFTLSGTAVTVGTSASATSTITVTGKNGYAGTVDLTCAVTSSPAGAKNPPTCAGGSADATTGSGTGQITISTGTNNAALDLPARPGSRWFVPAGGAALACILFFGIPARRRGWKSMLALLFVVVSMAGVGCGSSFHGSTRGTYTVTVTGKDHTTPTITTTTIVQVTVQ